MNWNDEGLVLSVRPHGETSLIVDALTRAHGRHAGLVRGGRRRGSALQPGTRARLHWNARLAEHLGTYRVEPMEGSWVSIRAEPGALAALASMLSLLSAYLAAREPHPNLCAATFETLSALARPEFWPTAYAHWEVGLLRTLGYGLDLRRCAETGATEGLSHICGRTGRALSRNAEAVRAGQALELPAFLVGGGAAGWPALRAALQLTGHFFEREIAWPTRRPIPEARMRLADWIDRQIP